ncbi:DUF6170 family protein [Thalassotalea ganghwensis]
MTIFFSSKNIPELSELSFQERQEKVIQAQQKFSVPEKLILNLLKLGMLIPPFLFLARQEWAYFSIAALISVLVKMWVYIPVQLAFCRKYLSR